MATNLENSNVATRENRIGSITGYIGSLSDLASRSECGTLKGCSRCFSQSSTCLSSCALGQLSAIRDVAIIHHGPAGCSVASAGAYYLDKVMAKKRGVTNDTVYVGTDMNENDTIFGSTEALADIIFIGELVFIQLHFHGAGRTLLECEPFIQDDHILSIV